MNRKQWAIVQAAQAAALANATDWGRDYHHMWPAKMLIEVAREAAERFEDKGQQLAFIEGYQAARAQRDAYLQEGGR